MLVVGRLVGELVGKLVSELEGRWVGSSVGVLGRWVVCWLLLVASVVDK